MSSQKVIIIQTSDGVRYKPMMDITEALHRKYCQRWGYEYRRFDGIKRGFKPWHAAFNRIYMVLELLAEGTYDWILHMDADGVIVDIHKSLSEYLDPGFALVACRGSTDDPNVTWNVNNGIMFINARHPDTRAIFEIWKRLYENVKDDVLQGEPEGIFMDCSKHVNDQDMLCLILFQERFRKAAKIYRGEQHNAFNYGGPFIRQIIRGLNNTTESRIDEIRRLVTEILGKEDKLPNKEKENNSRPTIHKRSIL